ncbi:Peroxisomal targeting signal receptor [Nakaseomyces bracarensis]|uniref:Peroxisomal targeting signal receptor n=1 Tax=Nakaseomyces bracarensis TaxID=273131 RepID=A0ABR4NPV8_9SACH
MDCHGGNSVLQLSRRIDTSLRINHRYGRKEADFVRQKNNVGLDMDVDMDMKLNEKLPLFVPMAKTNEITSNISSNNNNHINNNMINNSINASRLINEFNAKVHKSNTVSRKYGNAMYHHTSNYIPQFNTNIGLNSYRRKEEFDWDTEFANMEQELELVEEESMMRHSQAASDTTTATGARGLQATVGYHYSSDMEEDCQNIYDYVSSKATSVASNSSSYMGSLATADAFIATYEFNKDNKYMYRTPSAYEVGCILMENNCNLTEIALAFEAAIQEQDQQHLIDSWYRLGLVQLQNEREEKAVEAFQQVLALDPNHIEAMKLLAVSYINEGDKTRAIGAITGILAAKGIKTEEFKEELNIVNTKEVLEHILRHIPSTSININHDKDILTALALINYLLNRPENSIKCFEKILEHDPKDEIVWNHLGATMANSSQYERAIKTYLRTIELKPSFVRARYNLGSTLVKTGEYQKGIESLLIALTMQGTKVPIQFKNLSEFIEILRGIETETNNTIIKSLKNALTKLPPDDDHTAIEVKIKMVLN